MNTISFQKVQDEHILALVTCRFEDGREFTTPIWYQNIWNLGPDAFYIRRNGCGHCCTAMALRLLGFGTLDPAEEYALCLKRWGPPKGEQDHFITVNGIVDILSSFGVRAEAKGVSDPQTAAEEIYAVLKAGGFVIFWSSPKEGFSNPFSPGEHYVLAAGIFGESDADEKIIVLNSGLGVQLEDLQTVQQALFTGANPTLNQWGVDDLLPSCSGYVTIFGE